MEEPNNEHVITLFEACEMLNKSARTVSRYVRKGFLNPVSIKSRKGTMEYRFSRAELNSLKDREDEIRQITFAEDQTPETVAAQFASVDMAQDRLAVEMPFTVPGAAPEPSDKTGQTGQTGQQPSVQEEIESRLEILELAADAKNSEGIKQGSDSIAPRPDNEIIDLLKETTGMLRDQLQVKDEQIKSLNEKIDNLIERDRETNILLKGLQDKFLYLEKPKKEPTRGAAGQDEIIQATVMSGHPAKENEEKTKGKKERLEKTATVKDAKENKNGKKENKGRQDTPDKPGPQKNGGQDKPKKGFWGGLFGK
ncbi:MAG TPA: helix-turn-helix domain-containing protein [Candidatus Paceibacterota bacterium]|nr:helix-turn-helix domain-containing protein [Candidatus Pacearchaeota archaeon]HRZ51216.1 helix-turn-helix domain-containing protein [Candidatus Paceibacterota bacterium]HSA36938.1 helix-turn-helix domain-containing protein [Candidatus Paceibacterota bacterium]